MPSTKDIRRRPLRTYGRQPAPAALSTTTTPDAPELPPTKRRRISSDSDGGFPIVKSAGASNAAAAHTERTPAAAPAITPPPQEQKGRQALSNVETRVPPLPVLPPTSTARRSTITGYFRVVPHLKSETSSCAEDVTSSDPPSAAISTSSPPSSPPPTHIQPEESRAKRKPRRLTTKAKPRDLPRTTIDSEGEEEENKASQDGNEDGAGTKARNASQYATDGNGGIMAAANASTLNRGASTRPTAAADKSSAAPGNLPRKRQKPEAMIQQTLNLSMSEKGFTECAECSMLYNPLHEKDRRFHARQHAAILKARELKDNVVDE